MLAFISMRIAHLETGRHFYGGAQQVLQLLDGLRAAGVDNELYCVPDSEIAAYARLKQHTVIPIPLAGDHDLRFARRLIQAFRKNPVDLVHVHSRRGADTFGGLAARVSDIPAVLSRRVDNPVSRAGALLKFWPYRRIIAISDAIRQELCSAGIASKRLLTIPDAIATRSMVLAPERDWFRQEFALQANTPVIGVVAQLIERKGHRHLLDALPLVLGDFPDCRVIFFGRGPLEQTLHEQVEAQELQNVVHFAGFRTDLERVMPCLDLLVHPAEREGMGVALLEAGAAALPVIAFSAGGVREVINDGVTGRLVSPGDTIALADAIRDLLANPAKREQFGVAARRRVEEKFSMDHQTERHLGLYRELCS